jgi:hypothetical protein
LGGNKKTLSKFSTTFKVLNNVFFNYQKIFFTLSNHRLLYHSFSIWKNDADCINSYRKIACIYRCFFGKNGLIQPYSSLNIKHLNVGVLVILTIQSDAQSSRCVIDKNIDFVLIVLFNGSEQEISGFFKIGTAVTLVAARFYRVVCIPICITTRGSFVKSTTYVSPFLLQK